MSETERLRKVKEINADALVAIDRVGEEIARIDEVLPDLRITEGRLRAELNKVRIRREALENRKADANRELVQWRRSEASSASDIRAITAIINRQQDADRKSVV